MNNLMVNQNVTAKSSSLNVRSSERSDIIRALKQNTPFANKYNKLYIPQTDGALYCHGSHHGYSTERLKDALEKGGCIC